MNRHIYVFSGICASLASVICLFFDWKISTGVIIGLLSSYIYFILLNKAFVIKDDGTINKGGIFGFFFRILVIALPLGISVIFPNYFNIFGAFAGVMLFRVVMMFFFFKQKGEI